MSFLINSYRFGVSLLLDTYTGAAAAYGLRKLRTAYTGSAIKVRRASDNTEQDIGFSGNDLDTTAISTFCSGTTGHIRTWYDQSGNGNDLIQLTAGNQPTIYSGGAVITVNGNAAMDFDNASQQYLELTAGISSANNWTMFHVTQRRASSQTGMMGLAGATYGAWVFNDNILYARNRDGFESISLNATDQQLLTTIATSSNVDVYNDGTLLSTTFTSVTTTVDFQYYNRRSSDTGNGWGQELIFYASDKSSDRSGIETNINAYYGAF